MKSCIEKMIKLTVLALLLMACMISIFVVTGTSIIGPTPLFFIMIFGFPGMLFSFFCGWIILHKWKMWCCRKQINNKNNNNISTQKNTIKKSLYFNKLMDVMKQRKLNKHKLIKLLNKYQQQIQNEYQSSVEIMGKYKDGIKESIANKMKSSKNSLVATKKSLSKFGNAIKNNINHLINGMLNKYSSQIAISGYYEIVIIFYGLTESILDESFDLLVVQSVLFGLFYMIGVISLFQQYKSDFVGNHNQITISIKVKITLFINIIVLYILFMSIDLQPFDNSIESLYLVEILNLFR